MREGVAENLRARCVSPTGAVRNVGEVAVVRCPSLLTGDVATAGWICRWPPRAGDTLPIEAGGGIAS